MSILPSWFSGLFRSGKKVGFNNIGIVGGKQKSKDSSLDSDSQQSDFVTGKYVIFGQYPYGDEKDVKPIEWLVLARQDHVALLLSRYCLDCRPFNAEHKQVGWETCSLRQWLNNDFYNQAFNEHEKQCIALSRLENAQGGKTEDKIFCLSSSEARDSFFGEDHKFYSKYLEKMNEAAVEELKDDPEALEIIKALPKFGDVVINPLRSAKPTPYAISQGAITHNSENDKNITEQEWWLDNCHYWLRTPGILSRPGDCAASFVDWRGSVTDYGLEVECSHNGVRPAMQILL
ncbi:MAG: DUF6273 domain-containing protein [bacterium]|nr:DUF6273 domain-containing protein [bacterium]